MCNKKSSIEKSDAQQLKDVDWKKVAKRVISDVPR